MRIGAVTVHSVFDAADADADADAVEWIRELTGGRGVEFSVESSGVPAVMSQAVAALAPLGRAGILGVAPGDHRYHRPSHT